ncbi:MAG: pitrilysin family protein [Bacteroidales bacterium]|jgi:predicted Zn-dependent peptidase|nr:pitrilysin family protein [Bacteroidales bacterium]
MKLNRKTQPLFKQIESINLINPVKANLDNGIPLYIINAGTQDVLKIDISFDAGLWYQSKPLVASTVNEMLLEGTKNYTSKDIAEKLDYYGSFIQPEPAKDTATISFFTLKKYLPDTITLLADIIKNPIFPESELKTFMGKRKQNFLVEMEKVSNLARRKFNEQLFGANYPYGKSPELEDHDLVLRSDLIDFHNQYYHPANCRIIVAGKTDQGVVDSINEHFGKNDWLKGKYTEPKKHELNKPKPHKEFIKKENATQSAIRIGKLAITKSHPDYPKLEVVNTVLGGYFGSRLMKTIREEKGYTYGIGSYLVSLKQAGFFIISTEVGSESTQLAVDDIFTEIKKLRTEIISDEELKIAKNFMLGDMMRSFDGPFEQAQSYKSLIDMGIENDFFDRTLEAIKNITSDEIQLLANKYLNEEEMVVTVAGA